MKNSFSTLELILTIFISSLIFIYSLNFSKKLFEKNKMTQEIEIKKINLLSTKIFLQKHKSQLDKLSYKNNNLYFKEYLLLKDVTKFEISISKLVKIEINYDDMIKQNWQF